MGSGIIIKGARNYFVSLAISLPRSLIHCSLPSGRRRNTHNTQWVSRLWRWKRTKNQITHSNGTSSLLPVFTLYTRWIGDKSREGVGGWTSTHIRGSGEKEKRFCYFDNIIFSLFSATHRKVYIERLMAQRKERERVKFDSTIFHIDILRSSFRQGSKKGSGVEGCLAAPKNLPRLWLRAPSDGSTQTVSV